MHRVLSAEEGNICSGKTENANRRTDESTGQADP